MAAFKVGDIVRLRKDVWRYDNIDQFTVVAITEYGGVRVIDSDGNGYIYYPSELEMVQCTN